MSGTVVPLRLRRQAPASSWESLCASRAPLTVQCSGWEGDLINAIIEHVSGDVVGFSERDAAGVWSGWRLAPRSFLHLVDYPHPDRRLWRSGHDCAWPLPHIINLNEALVWLHAEGVLCEIDAWDPHHDALTSGMGVVEALTSQQVRFRTLDTEHGWASRRDAGRLVVSDIRSVVSVAWGSGLLDSAISVYGIPPD